MPEQDAAGRSEGQLRKIFAAVYWSPNVGRVIHDAVLEMDCEQCKTTFLLKKPARIRWQAITSYG